MFLEVKQAAACVQALDRLGRLLETILKSAAGQKAGAPDLRRLEPLVEPALRPLLRRRQIWEAVEGLFALDPFQKQKIWDSFQNDMAFPQHISDKAYRLSRLSDLSQKGAKAFRKLCESLYEVVRTGIPAPVGGPSKEPFTLRTLRESYQEENGALGRVCPACVRQTLFDVSEGEIDHYFPKSQHPALAFHPCNLLPSCSDCNGPSMKGQKEPVDPRDAGAGELCTVFLPYLRAAKPEVELQVGPDCAIVLTPSPSGDRDTPRRIENIERLYHLGERWSKVLEHVYDDLSGQLEEACAAGTPQQRLAQLRKVLRANAACTRDRSDFVKGVYCAWLDGKSDKELMEMMPPGQPLLLAERPGGSQ